MSNTVYPATAASVRSSAGIDTAAQALPGHTSVSWQMARTLALWWWWWCVCVCVCACVCMCVAPYVDKRLFLCPRRRGTAFFHSFSTAPPGQRGPCGSGSTGQGRCVYGAWCVLACLYKHVGQVFVHPRRSRKTMPGVAGTYAVCKHLQ